VHSERQVPTLGSGRCTPDGVGRVDGGKSAIANGDHDGKGGISKGKLGPVCSGLRKALHFH